MTKTHNLAALMRLPDLELRTEIQTAATADPLQGLHLCHELLNAEQYYPTRRGLNKLVGREVERIGQQLTQQPELTL
jgi:hypothetical protein